MQVEAARLECGRSRQTSGEGGHEHKTKGVPTATLELHGAHQHISPLSTVWMVEASVWPRAHELAKGS
jgi:hypothetical protein